MTSAHPLDGRGIVITRAEAPGGPLERRLAALGARVLRWCALEIAPPENPGPLESAARQLERYDWIVFASAHAVQALASSEARVRAAAVGPATAKAAEHAGWHVERVPREHTAAGLVECFRVAGDARGARMLLPASARGRAELAEGLRSLGAIVEVVEAYRPVPATLDAAACRAALKAGAVHALTFTSPSAVSTLEGLLGPETFAAALRKLIVVSIGPTTSQALRDHQHAPDAEAKPHTLDGLAAAVVEVFG